MTFRVAQKVTMARPYKWSDGGHGEKVPVFGEIYTVRSIVGHMRYEYLKFFEILNPEFQYPDMTGEMDFWASVFRPVVNRETDISIFRSLLHPSKAKHQEDIDAVRAMLRTAKRNQVGVS